MKKVSKQDEMRPEYDRADLGEGIRGKYHEAYRASSNVVLLRPEMAKIFPAEEAVNEALISLIRVARTSVGQKEN